MSVSPYFLLMGIRIFVILLLSGLAAYAWRHRRKRGVFSFFWLLVASLELAIVKLGLQFTSTDQAAQVALNAIFGTLAVVPVIFLVFVLQYTGHERWLSGRRIAALGMIPAQWCGRMANTGSSWRQ